MEYNSENMKFITPPAHLRLKFLRIDAMRISVLKGNLSKQKFYEVLNKSISENRVIINGK